VFEPRYPPHPLPEILVYQNVSVAFNVVSISSVSHPVWGTVKELKNTITGETTHRWLIHDRDAIYAPLVDDAVEAMGLRVLKTPARTPEANAFCERVIGTMRRECLDWLIPLTTTSPPDPAGMGAHYNRGRPHMSLGPGLPRAVDSGAGPHAMRPSSTDGSPHRSHPDA
jgi:hypothetical protein